MASIRSRIKAGGKRVQREGVRVLQSSSVGFPASSLVGNDVDIVKRTEGR